ncbi:hypothetical protein ABE501_08640 [Comamonas testosteroni]
MYIRVQLFKDSRESFIEMLQQEKIDFSEIQMFSTVAASGSAIGIHLLELSPYFASLSAVLIAWIKSRSSRKVIITTKDRKVVHIEGMSQEDVIKILSTVEDIAVIDTEKSPKRESAP